MDWGRKDMDCGKGIWIGEGRIQIEVREYGLEKEGYGLR